MAVFRKLLLPVPKEEQAKVKGWMADLEDPAFAMSPCLVNGYVPARRRGTALRALARIILFRLARRWQLATPCDADVLAVSLFPRRKHL